MAEKTYLLSQPPATAQPPPPNPRRAGIRVHWSESAATIIEIRQPLPGLAAKLCRINWKSACLRGLNAPLALNHQGKWIPAGLPERRAN
jgi:hypothetical protein